MNVFFTIVHGVSFELEKDGSLIVHMPSRDLKLEGPSVPFIVNELFPLLKRNHHLAFIEGKLKNAPPGYLQEILAKLEAVGIIHRCCYNGERTVTEDSTLIKETLQHNPAPVLITARYHYSLNQLLPIAKVIADKIVLQEVLSSQSSFIKDWTLLKKDAGEPVIPYVITAQYQWRTRGQIHLGYCSGKGLTLQQAEISAAGEAAERYTACCYSAEELTYASYNNVKEKALDPRQLVLYLPEQYSKLPFKPFKEDLVLGWVNGYSLVYNKPILIPAIAVFLDYRLQNENENFAEMQSSGLAAGSSLANAIVAGALEVIERDAFMNTWYNRLPCGKIDIRTHPSADIIKLFTNYQELGVQLHLLKLPTDAPCHVFMAIAVGSSEGGPFIAVGLGSGFSVTAASTGALLEVAQVRASSNNYYKHPVTLQRIKELVEHPELVNTINDHRLLYATPDHAAAFDFLFASPLIPFEWDKPLAKEADHALKELVSYLHEADSDLVYYNLGMPETESAGYFSSRVILPGFQPLHFGYYNMRLAGRRLYELPVQSGFKKTLSSANTLHNYPHPLA